MAKALTRESAAGSSGDVLGRLTSFTVSKKIQVRSIARRQTITLRH
jgi:hypothetical protein